jgi:hypothetical protein
METNENNLEPEAAPKLFITEEAQYYLQKGGQWAYFLGIVGFVVTGFIVLGALFIGSIFGMMSKLQPAATPMPSGAGAMMTFIYLLLALFYFFFSLYLYQFGDKIKKAVLYNNTADVTIAFNKLKSFFKLWGITTIVIIALYALIFIFVIIAGVGAMSMLGK